MVSNGGSLPRDHVQHNGSEIGQENQKFSEAFQSVIFNVNNALK